MTLLKCVYLEVGLMKGKKKKKKICEDKEKPNESWRGRMADCLCDIPDQCQGHFVATNGTCLMCQRRESGLLVMEEKQRKKRKKKKRCYFETGLYY